MKFYYTYILQSEQDKSTYIGYAEDLRQRLNEHNAGKTKSIRHKVPFKLVYFEAYLTKTRAIRRERELKRSSYKKAELHGRIFYTGKNK